MSHLLRARRVIRYLCCFCACSSVFSQAPSTRDSKVLRGCLTGSRDRFYLASVDGGQYLLTGNTSALTRYARKDISVDGKTDSSTEPWPSFQVTSVRRVFDTPSPTLSASLSNSSRWQRETNRTYGIKFAIPRDLTTPSDSQWNMLQANFATDQNVIAIRRLEIPREVYPRTNFVGGAFAIFLNPEMTNAQSCGEFGKSDARFRSIYRAGDVQYARMKAGGAAAGTSYNSQFFHTFQNGICYEIAFEFAEYNTGNEDLGCTVPVMRDEDELELIKPFLREVSFIRPALAVAMESNRPAIPRVSRFDASSETADDITNRGQITFSWSTEGADYVELLYRCVPASTGPGVVILEGGNSQECENANRRLYSRRITNRSPNGSQSVLFGNFHQPDPISIVVRIVPFSHGMAFPDSAKSITVQVDPHNPIARSVATANGNILLTYSPSGDGTHTYTQGSPLTIEWKDAHLQDPCINLYLVQEDHTGTARYRLHIGDGCLKPSHSGSYRWTISDKYAGDGYRIFAISAGGISSGLGQSFTISRTSPPR